MKSLINTCKLLPHLTPPNISDICLLTENKVSKLLTRNHRTPCPLDPISTPFLQTAAPTTLAITHIINSSLPTSTFPSTRSRKTPLLPELIRFQKWPLQGSVPVVCDGARGSAQSLVLLSLFCLSHQLHFIHQLILPSPVRGMGIIGTTLSWCPPAAAPSLNTAMAF